MQGQRKRRKSRPMMESSRFLAANGIQQGILRRKLETSYAHARVYDASDLRTWRTDTHSLVSILQKHAVPASGKVRKELLLCPPSNQSFRHP